MSNIEKIRQEIERLKKILEESTYYLDNSQQALGYSFALDDFKEFIDSLPDESKVDVTDFCKPIDPSIAQCIADNFWEMLGEEEKPSEDLEEAAEKRKMGITPIGIIRMKVQELKWADVDKAGDLDIHPLEKEKYNYAIKQCDKIIAFIDNLPLTITKESPELNEAANDYQTTFNKTIGPFFHDDQKRAFIDGALWQARQFIKGTPNRKP